MNTIVKLRRARSFSEVKCSEAQALRPFLNAPVVSPSVVFVAPYKGPLWRLCPHVIALDRPEVGQRLTLRGEFDHRTEVEKVRSGHGNLMGFARFQDYFKTLARDLS